MGGGSVETGLVVLEHEQSSSQEHVFKMMGCSGERDKRNSSGADFFRGAPEEQEPLGLNEIHRPAWHALYESAATPVHAPAGGIDASWNGRPRVLVAVGYSLKREVVEGLLGAALESPSYFSSRLRRGGQGWSLRTKESVCYQIVINLLGLRSLPSGLYDAKLQASSAWEGAPAGFLN